MSLISSKVFKLSWASYFNFTLCHCVDIISLLCDRATLIKMTFNVIFNVKCQNVLEFLKESACLGFVKTLTLWKMLLDYKKFIWNRAGCWGWEEAWESTVLSVNGNMCRGLKFRPLGKVVPNGLDCTEMWKISVVKQPSCPPACVNMGIRKGVLLKGKRNVQKNQMLSSRSWS